MPGGPPETASQEVGVTIAIRAAADRDVDGVVDVLAEFARESGGAAFDAERVRGLVGEYVDTGERVIYVADREGVVGYIAVHWVPFPMLGGREGYISDLVVRASARSQGIGSQLLAAVEARARELSCARLMLNNRLASESYAQWFYTKRGFHERDAFANLVKALDPLPT
jgi:ribosomal protein S18 acetylase RimI-like enzyme